jgi:hypothetical protein
MKHVIRCRLAIILKAFFILLFFFSKQESFAQGTGANTKCYADKDHDGFGDPNDYILIDPTLINCSDVGRADNGLDCDDNNAAINPNTVWYKDADGDGYTDGTKTTQCDRPPGYKLLSELKSINDHDCNDTDPNITITDIWFLDPDNDGYITIESNSQITGFTCKPAGNYVSLTQLLANGSRISSSDILQLVDCNENDPLEHPNQQWYPDLDGDSYPGSATATVRCDRLPGYKVASELISLDVDCNDNEALEHPGQVWYVDFDNDGYAILNSPLTQCSRPLFYKAASELRSTIYSDCDDHNATLNPETTWYKDFDNDGYDDGIAISSDCNPGAGYITSTKGHDCNDNDASINPETQWYLDADNDGYYTSLQIGARVQCESPGAGWRNTGILGGGDCDDHDATINPATEWYFDADNDGYYTSLQIGARVQCESPGAGWRNTGILGGGDCNDNDATINPGTIWYLDADNDGYYDPSYIGQPSCHPPADGRHYIKITKGQDCNDNDATYNPETTWVIDKDGDGYYTGDTYTGCLLFGGLGYVRKTTQLPGDCDDNNAALNPSTKWYKDADGDGYSDGTTATQCSRPTGYKLASELVAISGDCNDNDATAHSMQTYYRDADGDGYGNAAQPISVCSLTPPAGYVANNLDCNDANPSISPVAVEVCGNKVDDNCNNVVDENTCYACQNGTSLTTTNITSTSAQTNWSAMANPQQWQLQYKSIAPGAKWIDVLLTGNIRSVTITSLKANQTYNWHIRAKCNGVWTSYSAAASFKTQANTYAETRTVREESTSAIMQIKAIPNPTSTSFNIVLKGFRQKEEIKMLVVDVYGRTIEQRILPNEQTLTVGDKYRPGVYIVRFTQGEQSEQLKLIKLPN